MGAWAAATETQLCVDHCSQTSSGGLQVCKLSVFLQCCDKDGRRSVKSGVQKARAQGLKRPYRPQAKGLDKYPLGSPSSLLDIWDFKKAVKRVLAL